MKKRTLAMLLCLAMLGTALSGCGASADSGTSSATETAAASAAPSAEVPAASEAASQTEPSGAEAEQPSAAESNSGISYPVADGETYSISVVADGNLLDSIPDEDPANCYGVARMQEATGIKLDYTVFAMLSDDMTLMLASGDWTDIICKIDENYTGGIQGALDEDVILDLAPYIDQDAPDYAAFLNSDELYTKTTYTDDGKLGAFYKFSVPSLAGWALRKDWMDDAGITDVPQTYDQMEDACLTILDKHPELSRCIALAGSFIAEGYESELMYGYGLNTMSSDFNRGKDGKIFYAWTSDAARDYLEMIARWTSEGIFNKDEMLTGDLANFGSDLYVGTAFAKHNGVELFGDDQLALADDANFAITPMNEPTVNEGDTLMFGGSEMGISVAWSITTTCPDPETLIKAINWIYTDEGTTAMNFGKEGTTYTVADDGSYQFTDLVLNNPDGIPLFLAVSIATGLEVPGVGLQSQADAKLSNQQQLDAQDYWATQDRTTDGVRRGTLTTDETQKVAAYADIDTYVQEKAMAFAVGETELNDETWNDFVSTIDSMGIDDIVAVYQEAQDRYDAK